MTGATWRGEWERRGRAQVSEVRPCDVAGGGMEYILTRKKVKVAITDGTKHMLEYRNTNYRNSYILSIMMTRGKVRPYKGSVLFIVLKISILGC